jgi:hypothetical protein
MQWGLADKAEENREQAAGVSVSVQAHRTQGSADLFNPSS